MTMITQYITSKQKLLLAVASRTFKVLSLLIIFSVGINTNNLFAQGVPANPNDPDSAPAPTITSQPSSMTACAGSTASFSVSATAGSSISYQWKKDGVNIGGATSSTLTLNAVTSADAGSYSVDVTSGGVPVASSTASLVVTTPALSYAETLSTCASTYVLDAGTGYSSVTWSASAGGSTLPSNPGDPDGNNLTPSQYVAASNGWYKVVAVPASGCTLVDSVYVIVNMGPTVITSQPSGSSINGGASATFSVSATGLGTLTYQWFKNGVAISGATSTSYTVSNATGADAGNYTVDVTGTCGTVTSNAATLAVNTLTITSQPVSATQCAGTNVTFSVSATVSSGSISYQWSKNGVAISGETNSSLTLTGISASDAGSYSVEATSGSVTATSNAATLTVNALTTISSQPVNQSIFANGNASFSVTASGSGALAYQWSVDGIAISGETNPTLNINNATPNNDADYSVEVTGACGVVTSNNAHLTVTVVNPPAISAQPASASQCAGSNVSFSVTASVTNGSMSYQWSKNGVNIAGATSSSLSLSNILGSDAGSYAVVVTGMGGTTTSNAATLTVNAGPSIVNQPLNQFRNAGQNALFKVTPGAGVTAYTWKRNGTTLNNGGKISGARSSELFISNISNSDAADYSVELTFGACGSLTSNEANLAVLSSQPTSIVRCAGQTAVFSVDARSGSANISYQWSKNGVAITNATSNLLILQDVSNADNGNYSVSITAGGLNVNSLNAALSVNAATVITVQPISTTKFATQGHLFTANATGSGSVTFQWLKDANVITGATSPSLNISNISSSSAGNYTLEVTGACGTVYSDDAALSVISAVPTSKTVCAGSSTSFSTTVSSPSPVSYQWRRDGSSISGQTNSSLNLSNATAAMNGIYSVSINVNGITTAVGSASLLVNANTAIVSQPNSQTRPAGTGVTFSVSASGTGAISYQWAKNGSPILGQTNFKIDITNLAPSDAGAYSVTATSSCGSAASNAADLTVTVAAPTITANPTPRINQCSGTSASMSVSATGYGSLSYQWRRNGVNIDGATNATLSLNSLSSADAGTYTVVVGNLGGSVTSASTVVSIKANTAISSHPVSFLRRAGQSALLTVSASGADGGSFQWKKNGIAITAATGSTLNFPNITSTNAGDYSVDVTFGCGTVSSNSASLTVLSSNPNNTSKCAGQNASFSATVDGGSDAISYQWTKNGVNLSGQTSATLNLSNVSVSDIGNYAVNITVGGNDMLSNNASLTVSTITGQPTSMLRRAGQSATFLVNTSSAAAYQWKKDGSAISGATSATYTVASAAGANAGDYTVDVIFGCGTVSSNSASLAVLTGNPSNVTKCAGENASFSVSSASGSDALSIQWLKNNVIMPGQTGSTLSLSNVSVSDVANYSALLTMGSSSLLSNGASLLVNTSATISSQPVSAVIFASQSVAFSAIVTGNLNGVTYQWTKDGSPISNSSSVFGATTSTLSMTSTSTAAAGSYVLNVTGNCGVVSSSAANLAIVSTFKLADQSMCAGNNATFSVSASGSGLTYQWRKDGSNISGANSSSYTMTGVNASNAASYSVVVGNGGSSTLTTGAGLLVVRALPTITSQPSNVNVAVGGNANFSVSATNATAFRWFRVNRTTLENPASPVGGSVAGAFTNSLTLNSVKSAFNNYRYICRITGACGNIVSDTVRLTVGGIAKNELASVVENTEMNLFPVPAQNVINLVTNGVAEGSYSIRILDQTGKLVMDKNTSGSEVNAGLSIEISDMSTGAYFLELKNANGEVMSMSKFIKIGN